METAVEEQEIGADMARPTSSRRTKSPSRKASPRKPLITRKQRPSPPKRRRR